MEKEVSSMNGVTIEEKDGEVIVRFATDGDYGRSKTGKSTIVATTGGFVKLGNGISLSLNAIR